jgi:hypothetical protein
VAVKDHVAAPSARVGSSRLRPVAPDGEEVLDYDRANLSLYAALLDADQSGEDWRRSVSTLMNLDPDDRAAEKCWSSHLRRAHWIVGAGLANALAAFSTVASASKK